MFYILLFTPFILVPVTVAIVFKLKNLEPNYRHNLILYLALVAYALIMLFVDHAIGKTEPSVDGWFPIAMIFFLLLVMLFFAPVALAIRIVSTKILKSIR